MFGPEFIKNAMIMFTRFGQDKKSIREREKAGGMTKDRLIAEFTNKFFETY